MSFASKHQMMMAYHSQANALKPATCVTNITSLPLELLDLEIQQSFKELYPTQTTVKIDQCSNTPWNEICFWDGFALWDNWWTTTAGVDPQDNEHYKVDATEGQTLCHTEASLVV